jgi:hypothetical protein
VAGLAVPATPAAAADGVKLIRAEGPYEVKGIDRRTARCPKGLVVYGGGADIYNGDHAVALTQLEPRADQSFQATAEVADTGYRQPWSLTVRVVCGPPLPGMELRTHEMGPIDSGSALDHASCSPGKVAISGGATIINGKGEVVLTSIEPRQSGGLMTVQALAHEDRSGIAGQWRFTVFAVCADPPNGFGYYTTSDPLLDDEDKYGDARCPSTWEVLGVFATTAPFTHFEDLSPIRSEDPKINLPLSAAAALWAYEPQSGLDYAWGATVTAACAPLVD